MIDLPEVHSNNVLQNCTDKNVFEENKRRNGECHWTIDTDSYPAAFKRTHFRMPLLHNAISRAVDHENEMKATALLHGAAIAKLLPLTGSSSNPRTANL
jgi:hypothetical protein